MNWLQEEYFLSVARTGSIGRSAQELYVTPSAISKQILALEQELKVSLFFRSGKGSELTPAGEVFYEYFLRQKNAFSNALNLARELDGKFQNAITLGVPREWDLSWKLREIAVNNESVDSPSYLKNELYDVNSLCKGLEDGSLDACICPREMLLNLQNVEYEDLTEISYTLLFSARHPAAKKERAEISDFSGCALFAVSPERPSLISSEKCKQLCRELDIEYGFRELPNMDSVINSVESGTGFTFLDNWCRVLDNRKFGFLQVDVPCRVSLAWNRNNQNKGLDWLLHCCRETLIEENHG